MLNKIIKLKLKHLSKDCNKNCSFCILEKNNYNNYNSLIYLYSYINYYKFLYYNKPDYIADMAKLEYFNTFSSTLPNNSFIDFYKKSKIKIRNHKIKKIKNTCMKNQNLRKMI